MAYEPTVWKNGDIITADKLNHIEDGIVTTGGGGTQIGIPVVVATIERGSMGSVSGWSGFDIADILQTDENGNIVKLLAYPVMNTGGAVELDLSLPLYIKQDAIVFLLNGNQYYTLKPDKTVEVNTYNM